jgi:hypothetical protein
LVELLVAAALILFIMSILSEAFYAGAKVFRDFKALGDMNSRLRTATRLLRDDLGSQHFDSQRKLSDLNFWTGPPAPPVTGPPQQGFFRIWQLAAQTTEGVDIDSVPSYATPTSGPNLALHFTVSKAGTAANFVDGPQSYYRAKLPTGCPLLGGSAGAQIFTQFQDGDSRFEDFNSAAGTTNPSYLNYSSRWAEVAWFMRPNGASTQPAGAGSPLYTLYRRQLVCLPDTSTELFVNPPATAPTSIGPPSIPIPVPATTPTGYEEMSARQYLGLLPGPINQNQIYFNCPNDLAMPARRFNMAGYTAGGILVTGLPTPQTTPMAGPLPGPGPLPVTDAAYAGLPPGYTGLPISGGLYPILTGTGVQNSDAVLNDVISLDVRVLIPSTVASPQPDFLDLTALQALPLPNLVNNPQFPPAGSSYPRVFDTWAQNIVGGGDGTYDYSGWATPGSNASAPCQTSILAIKVTIRVWDFKTEQTRQITIIQAM